jgi:hypothetical protein
MINQLLTNVDRRDARKFISKYERKHEAKYRLPRHGHILTIVEEDLSSIKINNIDGKFSAYTLTNN